MVYDPAISAAVHGDKTLTPSAATRARAAAVILLGAFYIATSQSSVFTFDHDMSLYLGLAHALAHGNGFVFNGSFNDLVPPGLPVLLAPIAVFTDVRDIHVFQSVIALFGILAVVLTFVWARAAHRPYPWLIALIVALIPGFYAAATGRVYAETPYMVASLVVLWWSERAKDADRFALRPLTLALVALCIIAAPALRTIGVVLPMSLVLALVHDTVRRRGKPRPPTDWRPAALALAAAGLAFVFTWSRIVAAKATDGYGGGFAPSYMAHLTLRNAQIPDSGTVTLPELALRLPQGALREGAHVVEMIGGLPYVKPLWLSPLILLVVAVVGIGWWRWSKRDQPLAAWYALLFVGVVTIWPFDEGERFLVPIAPLLVAFAVDGVNRAVDFVSGEARKPRSALSIVLWGVVLVAFLVARPWSSALSKQDLATLAAWPLLAVSWMLFRRRLATSRPETLYRLFGGAWLACFALGSAYRIGRTAQERMQATPDGIRLIGTARASAWLASHAPREAVVMAGEFAAVHFRTGLRTVPLLSSGRPEILGPAIGCAHPDYVVITDSLPDPYTLPVEPRRLEVMEAAGAGSFEQVAAFPGGRVFRFLAAEGGCPKR